MANKMIGSAPMSNAEKQRRHREKKRAELEVLKKSPILPFEAQVPDETALREAIKAELKKSWEPELKAERLAEERKKGRELARRADHTAANARISAICDCADFFVRRDRPDIAQHLLHYFMIDREKAVDALEEDKRTKSLTLASLDKSGAFNKPPSVIR